MAPPFPSLFKLPIPRRFVLLGLSAAIIVLLINLFAPSSIPPILTDRLTDEDGYFSGAGKWLPSVWDTETLIDRPPEFDDQGQCLFQSPYDALSPEEKRRAEFLVLEEVSKGVVRSKDLGDMESGDEGGGGGEFGRPKGMSHPILALLKRGEDKWNNRMNNQSKTIEEAAEKYIAKWNRNPPKGFEKWWKFATSVHVLLPDDYDAIMISLLPFYGLPIKTMQERLVEAETIPETFTLIIHDGKVELEWNDDYARDTWWASRGRADSQVNLMEPFLDQLPSLRVTFTIHDQPTMLLDHARMQELVTAAREGKVSNHANEDDRHEQIWAKACAPDSPLARGVKELPDTNTFISNHLEAMDFCEHPSYLDNHGMFLEAHDENMHPKPHTKLFPIFVPSKTSLHGDIPVTPIGRDGRRDDVGFDPDWSKKDGRLYWRGLATGLNHNKQSGSRWRQSHRERLHFLANDKTGNQQEVLLPIGKTGEVELGRYLRKELSDYSMNVALAGGNWQCDWDDGTCDEMDKEINWAEKEPGEKSNEFKYVFDTDGNAWSSRFPRLMASNNVVIKSSVFPEWNTQSLPEWFAYVPSKMDYSDLFSIMAFFRGSPGSRGGGHDEVARRIALNSQCWVEKTWRREDMQSYMFLLYLEYARLVSPDRDNGKMDYILPKHPKKPAAEPVPATVPESTLVPEEVVAAGGEDEVVPPAAPAPAPAPAADPIVAEEESSGDVTQPLDFEEIL